MMAALSFADHVSKKKKIMCLYEITQLSIYFTAALSSVSLTWWVFLFGDINIFDHSYTRHTVGYQKICFCVCQGTTQEPHKKTIAT